MQYRCLGYGTMTVWRFGVCEKDQFRVSAFGFRVLQLGRATLMAPLLGDGVRGAG